MTFSLLANAKKLMPNAAVPSVDQIIVRPGDRKKVTVSALTVTKWNVNVKRGDDPLRSICRWHHP
jgi:hypothetical protein